MYAFLPRRYNASSRCLFCVCAPPCVLAAHAAVLLYLNDEFEGGETVLYPGSHASETPEEGIPRIAVKPVAGSALCFGQSFKFGRSSVEHPYDAVLHEGVPVAGAGPRKYVLRSDITFTMPYRQQ